MKPLLEYRGLKPEVVMRAFEAVYQWAKRVGQELTILGDRISAITTDAYTTIQNPAGAAVEQRRIFQVTGSGVTTTDDPANARTVINVPGFAAAANNRVAWWNGGTLVGTDAGIFTDGDVLTFDKGGDAAARLDFIHADSPTPLATWSADAFMTWDAKGSASGGDNESMKWQLRTHNGAAVGDIFEYGTNGNVAVLGDTAYNLRIASGANVGVGFYNSNGLMLTIAGGPISALNPRSIVFASQANHAAYIAFESRSVSGAASELGIRGQDNIQASGIPTGGALALIAGNATGSTTGTGTGGPASITGGNASGSNASGTYVGGTASCVGGSATGSGGTRSGGAAFMRAGTGASANGVCSLRTAADVVALEITGPGLILLRDDYDYASALASPTITHLNVSSGATNTTYRAQGATSANNDGGKLQLQGGRRGGTGLKGGVRCQLNPDDSAFESMVELVEIAAGQRVVSLCFGANLTTTEMPANTGDRVAFLANAATAPTASPVSGGIVYETGGALAHYGSGGTVTTVAPA